MSTISSNQAGIGLLANAYLQADHASMLETRKRPGLYRGQPLPASVLKNIDDQTMLGLAAVLVAIERLPDPTIDLTDWAILGSPRFISRINLIDQFKKFKADGPWTASPHSIPHRCLHSVSGTISQALKIHGPNFGNGGGPGGYLETILSAISLLQAGEAPGAWVVCTGYDPEPYSDILLRNGWRLHALAMALVPDASAEAKWQLRVQPAAPANTSNAIEDLLPSQLEVWHGIWFNPNTSGSLFEHQPFQCTMVGGLSLQWHCNASSPQRSSRKHAA